MSYLTLAIGLLLSSVSGWAFDPACERVVETRASGTLDPDGDEKREDWQSDAEAWKPDGGLDTDRLDFSSGGGSGDDNGGGGSESWRGEGGDEGDPFALMIKQSQVDNAREDLMGLIRAGADPELVHAKRTELITALDGLYDELGYPEDYSVHLELLSHLTLNGFEPNDAGTMVSTLKEAKLKAEQRQVKKNPRRQEIWKTQPGLFKEIRALVFSSAVPANFDFFLNFASPERIEPAREGGLMLSVALLKLASQELAASIGMEGAAMTEDNKRGILLHLQKRTELLSAQLAHLYPSRQEVTLDLKTLDEILPYTIASNVYLTDMIADVKAPEKRKDTLIVWWGRNIVALDRVIAGQSRPEPASEAKVSSFDPAPLLARVQKLADAGKLAQARGEYALATKMMLIHSGSAEATVETFKVDAQKLQAKIEFNNSHVGAEYLLHRDADGVRVGELWIALSYLQSAAELLRTVRAEAAPEGYDKDEWVQALEVLATHFIRKANVLAGPWLKHIWGYQRMITLVKARLAAWEKLGKENEAAVMFPDFFGPIETRPGDLLEPLQDLRIMRDGKLQLPAETQFPGLYRTEVEKIADLLAGP